MGLCQGGVWSDGALSRWGFVLDSMEQRLVPLFGRTLVCALVWTLACALVLKCACALVPFVSFPF